MAKSRESISHFPTQKAAAILAYLAVTLPRSHSREVIAELFWPDKDPALARNSLSVTLSSLRKLLGDSLVSGRLQVGLHPDSVTTDVAEFEARLKAGDVAGAANLARAELLPGLYDDWVITERERLMARLEAAQQAQTVQQAQPKTPVSASLLPSEFLHNLPEPLVSFIGRERERGELAELLKTVRLVTLTGSGGSGKTRLSQYVARDVLDRFTDGVWLIELASLSDPSLVVRSIASALRVNEAAGKPLLDNVLDRLKSKNILLLLDNCEHVLDASAQVAEALLRGCPNLRILATSREALGVVGERPYRTPSLAPHEALQLFIGRGTAFCPDLAQTEQNTATLTALCTRLDGIPLAIELAAARLRTLSLDELHQRLSQSFSLLTGGPRTVLPRHQTLRGLIDWSYDLLTESEKLLFARLSVFAGGWTLEAAERVCSGAGLEEGAVHDVLTSLLDKSLVVVEREQGRSTRYRLLETVRQYAQERLEERGPDLVQVAHLEYFRDFCRESYPKQFQAEAVAELHRVEQEHDNLRVALRFATLSSSEVLQCHALEIAGALHRFWNRRNYLEEAAQWYRAVLALPATRTPSEAQGQCLMEAGALAELRGDYAEAESLYRRCLTEQKAMGHTSNVGKVLGYLAILIGEVQGDKQQALAYERESLVFAQRADDLNARARATINIGITLLNLGDYSEAQETLEQGLVLARAQGNKHLIAAALGNLGLIACERGEFSRACDLGRENLLICQEFGRNISLAVAFSYMGLFAQGAGDLKLSRYYRQESLLLAEKLRAQGLCTALLGFFAELDAQEGNGERAARLLGALTALRTKDNGVIGDRHVQEIDKLRTTLGEAVFERAFEEGKHLSLTDAISLAINP